MKTTLLQATSYFALAGLSYAQDTPKPAPPLLPPPAVQELTTPKEPPQEILSLALDGGPLREAVGSVQDALEKQKLPPLNVIISVSKDSALKVPPLMLRNVSGADALTLIATATGLELKPVVSADRGTIIGWEFTLPAADPAAGPSSAGGGAPGMPGMLRGPTLNSTFLLSRQPTPSGPPQPMLEAPPVLVPAPPKIESRRVPILSDVPIVGKVFTTTAPSPGDAAPAPLLGYSTEAANTRDTRVYALGTVTSYAGFPDVEKTLRDILESDNIKASEVKLSFHEKTNVLVANGMPRAHELIEQLVQALSKDTVARDAQQKAGEIRDLRELLDRRENMLKQLETQLMDVRKVSQENEAVRMKAEAELKLLKERPLSR